MSTLYDFAVIGGSISGALVAKKLSEADYKVVIIEKEAVFHRRICGEYLCPTGVELMQKEGLGDFVKENFKPIIGMRVFSPKGKEVTGNFPSSSGQQAIGAAVNRETLDNHMLKLAKLAGADILRGSALSQIETTTKGWALKLHNNTEINAKFVIGADGRGSTTARLLGVKKRLSTKRVALHCHMKTKSKTSRLGELHLFEDGSYIGINPTGDNEINISLVCDKDVIKKTGDLNKTLNHYISNSSKILLNYGIVSSETKVTSISPITNKVAKVADVNYALIGDASGFIDPLTGEGMYVALWTAKHLAERLIMGPHHITAVESYAKMKRIFFKDKFRLNRFFQTLIHIPLLVEFIASFLLRKRERASTFIGVIGNIHSPMRGLLKILK